MVMIMMMIILTTAAAAASSTATSVWTLVSVVLTIFPVGFVSSAVPALNLNKVCTRAYVGAGRQGGSWICVFEMAERVELFTGSFRAWVNTKARRCGRCKERACGTGCAVPR